MNNNWEFDYSELYTNQNGTPPVMHTPDGSPVYSMQPPKKRGRGKRVAAFALAVVLCGGVGFGGGYLGSKVASGNNSTVIYQAAPGASTPITQTNTGSLSVAQIAAIAGPSVVEVTTESVTTNPFFGQYVTDGAGSGVIISTDGYLLTNNHVVSGASQIKVTLQNKEEYSATLIGTDSKTDIAVLKIDASGLQAATMGDSDSLTVGEFALAVGNPLGTLGGTVTDGIISALNRDVTIDNQTMNLLQTNAAVSPGNSGGGLFNARGELVGIVNAKSSASNTEGLGFAIPVNTAMKVAEELISNGYVTGRPAMGVNVIAISDIQTAMQYGVSNLGVYVQSVTKGGAAEKAGLQPGDLFISIDGAAISTTADVTGILDGHAVGDTIEIQIVRDKQVQKLQLTLEEKQNTPAQTQEG